MRASVRTSIVAQLVGFLLVQGALARDLDTNTIRELAVYSDAVVIADVLDELDHGGHAVTPEAGQPQRIHFKVREVFRSPTSQPSDINHQPVAQASLPVLKPGALISVDMWEYALAHSDVQLIPKIERCLLFLERPHNDERYRVVGSGVRYKPFGKEDVLLPIQERNPGPWYMHLEEKTNWSELIKLTQSELQTVGELRLLRAEHDLERRGKKLLAWIESHRNELGYSRDPLTGLITTRALWGGVENELLQEISMSPEPEDAWKALNLCVSMDLGELTGIGFCSKRKREYLIKIATDDTQDVTSRRLALCQLCGQFTLWCTREETVSVTSSDRLHYVESLKDANGKLKLDEKADKELQHDFDRAIKTLNDPPVWLKDK
jgi:hypothetical protein